MADENGQKGIAHRASALALYFVIAGLPGSSVFGDANKSHAGIPVMNGDSRTSGQLSLSSSRESSSDERSFSGRSFGSGLPVINTSSDEFSHPDSTHHSEETPPGAPSGRRFEAKNGKIPRRWVSKLKAGDRIHYTTRGTVECGMPFPGTDYDIVILGMKRRKGSGEVSYDVKVRDNESGHWHWQHSYWDEGCGHTGIEFVSFSLKPDGAISVSVGGTK